MLNTTRFCALPVLTLLTTSIALAQASVPSCTVPSTNPIGFVAVEGTTELLPTLQINCSTPAGFTGPLNFIITAAGAPFANQLKAGSQSQLDVAVSDSVGDATGSASQSGANVVTVNFPSVTAGLTSVSISGLRVAPNTLPAGSSISVAVSSNFAVMGSPSTWTAAIVNNSISRVRINPGSYGTGGYSFLPLGYSYVSSSYAAGNTSVCFNPGASSVVSSAANVIVSGGFADALKTASDVTNGPLAATYGSNPNAGSAVTGTVLAVTFDNLNTTGVNYFVPRVIPGNNVTLTASLTPPTSTTSIAPAATGATATNATAFFNNGLGFSGSLNGPYASFFGGAVSGTVNQVPAVVALTLSNGTATVYYQVTASNPAAPQSFLIDLAQTIPSAAGVTTFSTSPVSVSVALLGQSSPAYPGIDPNAQTYNATPTGSSAVGLVTPCASTLMFPWILNANGFDTGIAIVNGSPVAGTAPTAGSCNVVFSGTGGAGANGSFNYNTGTVQAGSNVIFSLSAVNPGFFGYAVASCTFPGAHGYAGIFGPLGLGSDYLAPVITPGQPSAY